MKESLLKQIFYGSLVPWERAAVKDPEYWELNRKISEESKFFRSILSEEECQRFEKLEDMYSSVSEMTNVDAFSYGFKLAVRLMLEAVADGRDVEF